MNRILSIAFPLSLTVLLVPPAVAAPEIAVVGTHLSDLSEADQAAVAESLAEALAGEATIEVVTTDEYAARLAGREELVLQEFAFRRGREALSDAEALFERAQFEDAVPLFERAISRLSLGLPLTGDPTELVQAQLMLGVAHANLGDTDAAREVWSEVVVLSPDTELDPVNYPPKLTGLYAEIRAANLALQTGNLNVAIDGDAQLYLDGRPVESGLLTGLVPGTHHLYAVGDDGLRSYRTADVKSGQEFSLSLNLEPGSLGAADGVQSAIQIQELYRALGRYGDTELILVAGAQDDGSLSVCLYSSRSEAFSKSMSVDGGGDTVADLVSLAPQLAAYITESGGIQSSAVSLQVPAFDPSDNDLLAGMLFEPYVAPVVTVNNTDPEEIADEGSRRWILWTGLGVAAAGGAGVGVYMVTRPEDDGRIVLGPIP